MRYKPYTEKGISRVPCERCGKPSSQQWQICAIGNKWAGVCTDCDIELNRLVLEFMWKPGRLVNMIIEDYSHGKRIIND